MDLVDLGFLSETTFIGNSLLIWSFSIFLFFLVFFGIKISIMFLSGYLSNLAQKTDTKIDDIITETLSKFGNLFYLSIALFFSTSILNFPSDSLERLVNSLLIISGTYYFVRLFQKISGLYFQQWAKSESKKKSGIDKSIISLIRFSLSVLIWTLTFIFILQNFGINVSTLVGGLGIG